MLTIIDVMGPIQILIPIPIYIAIRFWIKDRSKRIKGCIAAFIVWLFISQAFLIPFALTYPFWYIMPGTIELAVLTGGAMIIDIGMQVYSSGNSKYN